MDWVIDTDVLVRAENYANGHEHFSNVFQLLAAMQRPHHSLVVDYNRKVISQYHKNLSHTGWVHKVLGLLVKRGQVRYVAGDVPSRIHRGLRSLRFDIDDYVFVGITTRTSDRLLLAEESDYSKQVVEFLSAHGVQVVDCIFAREKSSNHS